MGRCSEAPFRKGLLNGPGLVALQVFPPVFSGVVSLTNNLPLFVPLEGFFSASLTTKDKVSLWWVWDELLGSIPLSLHEHVEGFSTFLLKPRNSAWASSPRQVDPQVALVAVRDALDQARNEGTREAAPAGSAPPPPSRPAPKRANLVGRLYYLVYCKAFSNFGRCPHVNIAN